MAGAARREFAWVAELRPSTKAPGSVQDIANGSAGVLPGLPLDARGEVVKDVRYCEIERVSFLSARRGVGFVNHGGGLRVVGTHVREGTPPTGRAARGELRSNSGFRKRIKTAHSWAGSGAVSGAGGEAASGG